MRGSRLLNASSSNLTLSASGGSVSQNAMVLAAKVLAITAADLYAKPQVLLEAKADFEKRRPGEKYRSRIPAN